MTVGAAYFVILSGGVSARSAETAESKDRMPLCSGDGRARHFYDAAERIPGEAGASTTLRGVLREESSAHSAQS